LSLDKSEILFEEALKDLNSRCYNKAVSCVYFSVRMLVEQVLEKKRLKIPRRDDKLANLVETIGLKDVARAMRFLYTMRKKADYSSRNISEEEAEYVFKLAEMSFKELRKLLD